MEIVHTLIAGMSAIVVLQTAASLVRSRAWWVRIFDFPRVQILFTSIAVLLGLAYTDSRLGDEAVWESVLFLLTAAAVVIQVSQILPYTRIWRVQSPPATATTPADRRLRVVVSNVRMQNRAIDRWLSVVTPEKADLIIAVETDAWWDEQLTVLAETHPHAVRQPQDNTYGMVLYSRIPLRNAEIRHLIEEDVPSLFTEIEVAQGELLRLVVLHPRPPRPDIQQNSDLRDAELVRAAKLISEFDCPFIVAGDLNDVAWSHSTHLFQRIAGVLDPRIGRGIFSTYHADHWFARYPLDHVFHSPEFKLVELRRLGHVGSDHFPMLIEVALRKTPPIDVPIESPEPEDHEEAQDAIEDSQRHLAEETPKERAERREADS